MFTKDNFIKGLERLGNITVIKENDVFKLDYRGRGGFLFSEADLSVLEEHLREGYSFHHTFLYGKTHFEIAVENLRTPLYKSNNGNTYSSELHEYCLSISKPSKEYMFAIICQAATEQDFGFDFWVVNSNVYWQGVNPNSLQEFFDLFRIPTVKISAPTPKTIAEFKSMTNSYLFNIAYNHSVAFTPTDFSRRQRSLIRRTQRDG